MTPHTDMVLAVDVVAGKLLEACAKRGGRWKARSSWWPVTTGASPRPLTAREREAARKKAWDAIARKGAKSGRHGMAHALRESQWKLVFDVEPDKAVALYHLGDDLSEQKRLIEEPNQAERVKPMEQLYREIRASKRGTPVSP